MRKGQKMSDEQRKKISDAHKKLVKPWLGQYVRTDEIRKKSSERAKGNTYAKGRVISEETREKLRIANIGRKVPFKPRPSRQGKPTWNKGIPMREETKQKLSLTGSRPKPWMLGNSHGKGNKGHKDFSSDKSPHWIDDRTKIVGRHNRAFHDPEMKQWRHNVYSRDGFKCKINDIECDGRLEAHHILRWKDFPELRYEVNNGITLCHFHHPKRRVDEDNLVEYFKNLIA